MNYYFILGRENKISQKELLGVLAGFDFGFSLDSIFILSEHILEIKLTAAGPEVARLIERLGGTVKIYQKIAPKEAKLADLLRSENISKKIIFAISNYSDEALDTFRVALTAKKSLKIPLRIIAGKEDGRLSSAQLFQYKMADNIEYGLFESGWAKLIAVQNIDEWTRHDYGKPKSDAKSGMLPPKLARMMVNIAIGQASIENKEYSSEYIKLNSKYSILNSQRPMVVDPFCGSGNVLIEALAIECDVIGSDMSEKAVSDTRENLAWFIETVIPTPFDKLRAGSVEGSSKRFLDYARNDIQVADATKFDFGGVGSDFIVVTEPFLGLPRNSKLRLEEEAAAKNEISKLYLDFLRNLKLTADNKKLKAICIVFPLFELANGKKLSIYNECVDTISQIGYTSVCPPLEYGRDYQVVKRQVVLLQLT